MLWSIYVLRVREDTVDNNAARLRERLKSLGLSDPAIDAAWPTWWSQDADASTSARVELRFSVSRKLGLDPHSLLEDDAQPRFIWQNEARFKHLSGEGLLEQAAITSFGAALGMYLIAATKNEAVEIPQDPHVLRDAILRGQPFVRLIDLLSVCWSLAIPTVHLRVFPLPQKRMSAMSVRVGQRNAIMLGKDSMYPPHVAFYLAHEIAHISLGHLSEDPIVVDFEADELVATDDEEEKKADEFALQLLTGRSRPMVLAQQDRYSARELARVAQTAGAELGIEPGTLALCFGFSTRDWATANAAIRFIYAEPHPVWIEVNRIANRQLAFDQIPDDARSYVNTVLGSE
jgi:hypothetical protein